MVVMMLIVVLMHFQLAAATCGAIVDLYGGIVDGAHGVLGLGHDGD